ncbi:MAG: ATP-binding cassette domain-containing protein [Ktedonobacteraceae bacterium]|nr:ATP-binding cassette domain-containing protein [Ktedonobacteraceae bacterium]
MQGFSETDQLPALASPAMELDHLCKMFGSHRAVFNLSLALRRGEILGLLGPNGSGKTTTLNMVCGLSRPTIGNVRILGVDVHAHPRRARQHLGVVPSEKVNSNAPREAGSDVRGGRCQCHPILI